MLHALAQREKRTHENELGTALINYFGSVVTITALILTRRLILVLILRT